ncbi:MAG TPA: PKD domain-containing protein [Polyangia bacterium]|nr:PKD domain-containing protein [Polyangia bacterium]
MPRRAFYLLVPVLVIAGLFLLGRSGHPTIPPPVAAPAPRAAPPRPPRLIAPAPASPADPGLPAPIIDEVRVDKTEVCRGEENFATVRAHTPDGTDAHLYVRLGQEGAGYRVPFRLQQTGAPAMPQVVVQGRGGVLAQAPLPQVTVKDCEVERRLVISARDVDGSADHLRFTATLQAAAAARPFVATSYRWDFGDAHTAVTEAGEASHRYDERSQDTRFSYFLVTVTAADAEGHSVRGAYALDLVNPAFGELVRHGQVLIFAAPEDDGRSAAVHLRLRHAYREPVRVTRVTMREVATDQPGQPMLATRELLPASLGMTELPPGPGQLTGDLAGLRPSRQHLTRIFELVGQAADGKPAHGTFSLSVAPALAAGDDERTPNPSQGASP